MADKQTVYNDVCAHAERLFSAVRNIIAYQMTPSTFKAAFLEPLKTQLPSSINMEIFACRDDDFLAMFNGMMDDASLYFCMLVSSTCKLTAACARFPPRRGGRFERPSSNPRGSGTESRRPCTVQGRVSGAGKINLVRALAFGNMRSGNL